MNAGVGVDCHRIEDINRLAQTRLLHLRAELGDDLTNEFRAAIMELLDPPGFAQFFEEDLGNFYRYAFGINNVQ